MIHIHAPRPTKSMAKIQRCPTCKKRRKFWGAFYEWYGWNITCLSCGERWQDGERLQRPFCPGWRKDSVKRARAAMRLDGGKP